LLAILIISTIVFGGLSLQITGQDVQEEYISFANACWCIIMIMTTIGFGDVYPVTIAGRAFMTIVSFLILIIFSMLIATVIDKSSLRYVE